MALFGEDTFKIDVKENGQWQSQPMQRGDFVKFTESLLRSHNAEKNVIPTLQTMQELHEFVEKNAATIRGNQELRVHIIGYDKKDGIVQGLVEALKKSHNAGPILTSRIDQTRFPLIGTNDFNEAKRLAAEIMQSLTAVALNITVREDGTIEVYNGQNKVGSTMNVGEPVNPDKLQINVNGRSYTPAPVVGKYTTLASFPDVGDKSPSPTISAKR